MLLTIGGGQHLVVVVLKRVLKTYRRRVHHPIYRFSQPVACCLSCFLVREIGEQALPLHSQAGHNCIKDIILRIDERVLETRSHHYLVCCHEVEPLARCIHSRGDDADRSCLDSRLFDLVNAIADDCYCLGFAGQHTGRHTDEHIRHAAYAVAYTGGRVRQTTEVIDRTGRRGRDTLRGGERVVIYVSPVLLVSKRDRDLEHTACLIGRTGVVTRRIGDNTDVGGDGYTESQTHVQACLVFIGFFEGEVVGSAGFNPGTTACSSRVTGYVE